MPVIKACGIGAARAALKLSHQPALAAGLQIVRRLMAAAHCGARAGGAGGSEGSPTALAHLALRTTSAD
jgi:hypothetical protein